MTNKTTIIWQEVEVSREYKFRWRNKEKEIIVYDNEDNTKEYRDGVNATDIWLLNNILDTNKYILMQYTWIKDKKWVDIYEGDLIKYIWNSRIWEVFFDKFTLQYKIKPKAPTVQSYPLNMMWWVSVIWNIYQNSELLSE